MLPAVRRFFGRLIDRIATMDAIRREILIATVFLCFILALGTLGYQLLEGWNGLDALFMTFITLTTIGFQEVEPLSPAGRYFTMVIFFLGFGTTAFLVTRGTILFINQQKLKQRYLQRKISRMNDHYIICGYGRIGRRIARDLSRDSTPFIVIDQNPEKIETIEEEGYYYVEGNAEEESVLQEAGIDRAKGLIVSLPQDSDNVFVTLMARELNPSLFILSRTNREENARKMINAGANKVISPYEIGADRMAQVILRPHVDEFMEQVLDTGALALRADEVTIEDGAPLANHSIAESSFRQQFEAVILAIVDRETNEMKFNPQPDTRLKAGDVLIVLGSDEMISRLQNEGCAA